MTGTLLSINGLLREGLKRKAHRPGFAGRGLAAENPTRRGTPIKLYTTGCKLKTLAKNIRDCSNN